MEHKNSAGKAGMVSRGPLHLIAEVALLILFIQCAMWLTWWLLELLSGAR